MTDTDTALETREEAVAEMLIRGGRSLRKVRREFGLSQDELDAIIARTWPVDQRARVRMIMLDLGKLDKLIDEMFQRSFAAEGQVSAAFANAAVKALERKHDLCGMSAATRIELQVTPQDAPSSYERITAALMSLKYGPSGRSNGDGAAAPDPDQNAVSALSEDNGDAAKPFTDKP